MKKLALVFAFLFQYLIGAASEHYMYPTEESLPTGEEDSLVSLKDIKTAEKHYLGEGGQGIVYKGKIIS